MTFASGPGHTPDHATRHVKSPDDVSPNGRDPEGAGVHGQSLGTVQGLCFGRSAIFRIAPGSVSGQRFDLARFGVDLPHAVVRLIGNVNVVAVVERDAVWILKAGAARGAAVPAVSRSSVSRQCRDDGSFGVDSADEMVL